MLSNERTKELIEDIDKNSPWAIDATRDVVEHLNDEGYLREPEVEVPYLDIKEGDRIHLVYKSGDTGGPTEEIYDADHDRDYNDWAMPDENFTFFLIERPEKPAIKVEDLEPGTRFQGRLLNGKNEEWIVLKDNEIYRVLDGSDYWTPLNCDFDVEKVHD